MSDDFGHGFTYKIIEGEGAEEEPVVEFFDPEGNNVTPLPLYLPSEDPKLKEEVEKRVRKVPRPNTIMRTFLHVTTALYSMAGLGSLKQSRFYRDEINKSQDNQVNSNQEGDMAGPLGDPNDVFSEDKIDHEDVSARSNGPLEKLEAEHSKEIDIYLEETDTIWMLNIPGTCVEVDPDAPDKDEADGDNPNPQDEEGRVVFKYQLVDRWSQTLDFSKKRKGTQCDEIEVEPQATQTNDFIRSCTWSHKGQICRLKYSNAAHSLVKNTCDDLQSRVDVRGDYDSHECGLVIRNVTPEDSGLWGCYVTEYISKLALFKEPERKAALTRVQVVPKEDKGGLQGRASFCECDCGKN
ncbi:hypothetical protein TCAL_15302 [Tigriopus californicus]|uniref:Ig-like domain-containing protein n=1 Tax=Tigriopus californicus TaxID=6832 RepID=A0A553PMH0_TIGCA|nr:hypothetical protein TCAL_15302 [Tigriopus californicus]